MCNSLLFRVVSKRIKSNQSGATNRNEEKKNLNKNPIHLYKSATHSGYLNYYLVSYCYSWLFTTDIITGEGSSREKYNKYLFSALFFFFKKINRVKLQFFY
jgi:hypothetical protein